MESHGLIIYTPLCDPEDAFCALNDSLKAPWTHRATRYSNLLPRESHKNSDPNRWERTGAMNRALFGFQKILWNPMKDIHGPLWAMEKKRLKLLGITYLVGKIKFKVQTFTGWWFQIFFIFTTIWGRFPIWLILFRWVETTNQFISGSIWLSESKIFRIRSEASATMANPQDADKALCDPEGAVLASHHGRVNPKECETWVARESHIGSMGMLHWASVDL